MNTKLKIALLSATLIVSSKLQAQIIGFQFATPKTNGNELSIKPTLVAGGLKSSSLERGSGLSVSAEGGLVRAMVSHTRIETGTAPSDTLTAVAQDMYYKFSVEVNKNVKASFSSLNYKIRSSGGGAKVYYWKFSTDGRTFHKLAEPSVIVPIGGEGQTMPPVELSSIKSLQEIPSGTTVYFRLYTSGSNATSGTTGIGRSAPATSNDYALTLNGSVVPKK